MPSDAQFLPGDWPQPFCCFFGTLITLKTCQPAPRPTPGIAVGITRLGPISVHGVVVTKRLALASRTHHSTTANLEKE